MNDSNCAHGTVDRSSDKFDLVKDAWSEFLRIKFFYSNGASSPKLFFVFIFQLNCLIHEKITYIPQLLLLTLLCKRTYGYHYLSHFH